jgi:TolA-binding protein
LALARAGKGDEASESLAAALSGNGTIDPALERAAQVVLADSAMAKSDWMGAETVLRKLMSVPEGRTADATLKLGIVLARVGRGEEASAQFDIVARDFSKDPAAIQALFERGQIRVEEGKLDSAAEDFKAVISAEGKSDTKRFATHCLRNLASIASRQGRSDEAAELLGRVAASPDAGSMAADAQYERASALLANGKYQEAVGEYDRFLSMDRAHARAPDARAQRAIAVSRLGKAQDALAAFEAVEADASKPRPEILAAARYERAWDLKELKKDDEAREAFRSLLASPLQAPLEAHAALDLAQLELSRDDAAQALELSARALKATESADGKLDAVAERALYVRGACLLKLNKPAEAGAASEELLRRFPKSDIAVQAELLAGQAMLKAGKAESAAGHLQRVVDAGPADEVLGPALLSLGESLAASHQWAKSQAVFERYLAKLSKNETWFQAQFGIGWALENQGRHAEAVSAYREVVARHNGPTAARAQFQVGECMFAMKQYDDAVRELLKVDILYAYPEWSAAALYEAGRCLGQLNKNAEAQSQFKQVIERFGDTQWARLAEKQSVTTRPESLPGRTPGTPSTR